MQPMGHLTEENLEEDAAACILAHLLVEGIRIVASTAVQVRVSAHLFNSHSLLLVFAFAVIFWM